MTDTIDLLPEAYRQRTARRRANRDLFLMTIPVVLALVGTDLLLRSRVAGVRDMAEQAHSNAGHGEHLAANSKSLTERAIDLQASLDRASRPLAATRMTELLDDLIADRPAGVRFHELLCRHDPWSRTETPLIQLRASCSTADEFTAYLTALATSEALPPLRCQRSDILAGSGDFGFQLETDTGTAGERR